LEKAHKRFKDFADKSRREVKFQVGDEVWLNIKNFRLPKGLSHKFMGPYAGPFKVLEKKLSDTYKLDDALPSPGVNPLEGSPKCSCGKLGLERHSRLPTLERGKGSN